MLKWLGLNSLPRYNSISSQLSFFIEKPTWPLSLQRQQNALKYVTEEWCQIECELLRERGLWGPPIGSHLDKWMLEMTEGPCRMRKKMVRNDMFYNHYPYVPETEQEASVGVSTHHSHDALPSPSLIFLLNRLVTCSGER